MSYKDNPNNYTRCEKCKHIDRENEKCKITNDNWLVSDRAGTCHQFEGVESVKVRCIDNSEYERILEIDKEYDVIREETLFYEISIGDYSSPAAFLKERFEIVEDELKSKNKNEKLEENPHEKLAKEFEEQMEKVGQLFNTPIKPSYYQAGEFDVIAFCFKHNLDFATGNIIKYVTRAGKKDKDKTLEDLLKGKEYLERKIEWVKANG